MRSKRSSSTKQKRIKIAKDKQSLKRIKKIKKNLFNSSIHQKEERETFNINDKSFSITEQFQKSNLYSSVKWFLTIDDF